MLENAGDVAVGRVELAPKELPKLHCFIEFGQINLMNSHLDGLLNQFSQIWQQYERLVKEFSDCAGPKSALALWIRVHVRRLLLHLQSTLLRIFVLFLGLLICIIVLFIG